MAPNSLEISESQSKEICDLVNSSKSIYMCAFAIDHVRSTTGGSNSKVTLAKMVDIKLEAFTLNYVECNSESMCMMNSVEIQIDPPLQSGEHLMSKLDRSYCSLLWFV